MTRPPTPMQLALEKAALRNPAKAQLPVRKFNEMETMQAATVHTSAPISSAPSTEHATSAPGSKRHMIFRVPHTERIRWTDDERLAVARKWNEVVAANKGNKDVTLVDCVDIAQLILPEARRRRFKDGATTSMYYMEMGKFRQVLKTDDGHPIVISADATTPVGKSLDYSDAELHEDAAASEAASEATAPPAPPAPPPAPVEAPAPVQQQIQQVAAQARAEPGTPVSLPPAVIPSAYVPPPQTMPAAPLGPLEMALSQMVGVAVHQQIGVLVQAMREEQQQMRNDFQHLLTEQYDSLMSYWDPEYKKLRDAQSRYIPDYVDTSTHRDRLSTVRIRPKKVLISGGADDRYHSVQRHFKGVDFEFIDAHNARAVSKGGWYDLVVCTKFTSHPARDTLINLHGNKVVVVDGSVGPVIDIIRKRLEL